MGMRSQSQSLAALPPGKSSFTDCRSGWGCPSAGLDGEVNNAFTGIRPQDSPTGSRQLYPLHYTGAVKHQDPKITVLCTVSCTVGHVQRHYYYYYYYYYYGKLNLILIIFETLYHMSVLSLRFIHVPRVHTRTNMYSVSVILNNQ